MDFFKNLIKSKFIFPTKHLPHQHNMPLLQFEGVSVKYESISALDNLSFQIQSGEQIAVIGPNGAGKSTLFKVIAGLLSPTTGKVRIYGSDPGGHICVAYVPQRAHVDWNFPANVFDVVMMGRVRKIGLFNRPAHADHKIVRDALDTVRMTDLANRQINELSGGQQQRVFIARALAQEAELLLLDEPFSGLDINSQNQIFKILNDLDTSKISTMVSLHDLNTARKNFKKVMLLNKSILGFGEPQKVFSSAALAEAFRSHLHFVENSDGQLAVSDMCCPPDEDDRDD
ncbi:MAG: metal ABC transporter ATP-binding protein [Calditrichaceae bacterium]